MSDPIILALKDTLSTLSQPTPEGGDRMTIETAKKEVGSVIARLEAREAGEARAADLDRRFAAHQAEAYDED